MGILSKIVVGTARVLLEVGKDIIVGVGTEAIYEGGSAVVKYVFSGERFDKEYRRLFPEEFDKNGKWIVPDEQGEFVLALVKEGREQFDPEVYRKVKEMNKSNGWL